MSKSRTAYLKRRWAKVISNMKMNAQRPRSRLTGDGFDKWEVTLTPEQCEAIWQRQNGCCYWFNKVGVPIRIKPSLTTQNNPLSLSPDRLDTSVGYIDGNVVFCTRHTNMARGNMPADKFAKHMKYIHKAHLKANS